MTDNTGQKVILDLLNASSARSVMINDILTRAKTSGKISPADVAKILPREVLNNYGGLKALIYGIGEYLKREKVEIKNLSPQEVQTKKETLSVSGKDLKSTGRHLVPVTANNKYFMTKSKGSDGSEIDLSLDEEEEHDVVTANLFSSLNSYLMKTLKYRLLKVEEEVELARRIQEEGDLDARNELVLHNIRLVASIAKRFTWSKLPIEDLVQEGTLGLITAAEKFDYKQGFRFTTYAVWWIRQNIFRAITDTSETIRVPVHVREVMNKIRVHLRKTKRDIEIVPAATLAKELGLPFDKVKGALDAFMLETRSLYDQVYWGDNGGDDITLEDSLLDETCTTPEFAIQIREELEASFQFVNLILEVVKRVRKNSYRDYEIFKLIYGFNEEEEPWTLQMVGDKLVLSKERVRQIIKEIHDDLLKEGINLSKKNLLMYYWRIQELQKMSNILIQF